MANESMRQDWAAGAAGWIANEKTLDAVFAPVTEAILAEGPGRPFDRIVSRFGVMFFEDPEAAFANLRRAAAPAARFVFACWRSEEENPTFSLGSRVLVSRLDPPPEASEPGRPGPFAFADPALPASALAGAGWASVNVEAFDFTCDYGFGGGDGVEERLATILNGGLGRLAEEQLRPRLGAEGWEAVVEEVREDLRRNRVDGVLRFPGAVWIVTAVNPA